VTSGHVFVAASGFGKRVIPRASPYRFLVEGENILLIEVDDDPAVAIRPELTAMEAGRSAAHVADVIAGPAWTAWWLETNLYRVPIPEAWVAHVTGEITPSTFDLVGPDGSLIFIQVPRRVPPLERMVAPDQEMFEQGAYLTHSWVGVRYIEGGRVYIQRHAVVRIRDFTAIVTLQTPADTFSRVMNVHEFVTESLQSDPPA
jgi:hypothetical protein